MRNYSLNLSRLAVGAFLPCNVYDVQGSLLMPKGAQLTDEDQLETFLARAAPHDMYLTLGRGSEALSLRWKYSLSRFGRLMETRATLARLVAEPEAEAFVEGLDLLVTELHALCQENADLALASIMLCRGTSYATRHSVDTAIASGITAAAMQLDEVTQRAVIMGGLLMNVAMLELQDALQETQEPLTDEQRSQVKKHCEEGVHWLKERGVHDEQVLEIVRDHHERINGSGYPAGKQGDAIALPTQLVSLADIYCARLSSRAHRPAMPSKLALRWLFQDEHAAVNRSYAAWFIKALGIYPPGTIVRLINGNIGVVTHRGSSGNHPTVGVVLSQDGFVFDMPIRCVADDTELGIYEVLDPDEMELVVNTGKLWGEDGEM